MTGARVDERSQSSEQMNAGRRINAWAWLGIGVAAALVGLLPWMITGMRLPLQNLWATPVSPAQMPIGMLPFSQYSITLVAGIIVVGAASAGLVSRSTRSRLGRRGFAALAAGVLGVQVIAIVQTSAVVDGGLRPGRESTLYLAAMVAVALASFVVGVVALSLISRMPRAGALIGMSIGAIATGWWASALVVPDRVFVTDFQLSILGVLPWLPSVLCGVAIAWCGVKTVARVIAGLIVVAASVIGPALATAVTAAAGARVLARYPAEMLDYGGEVFRQLLTIPELTLRPIVTSILVAGVGLALREVLRRRAAASV